MKKIEAEIIISILILIIILGIILIYKIQSEPLQNQEMYEDIYAEYKQVFNTSNKEEKRKDDYEIENTTKAGNTEKNNAFNTKYKVIGEINIPKIEITYPIIYKTTEEYLKIAPTKYAGPDINEIGNFCIVAHNYRYNKEEFFSRLNEVDVGDKVFLTDISMKMICYKVNKKYEIDENDLNCLNQETNGKREVTLITCTKNSKKRLVIKGIEENE